MLGRGEERQTPRLYLDLLRPSESASFSLVPLFLRGSPERTRPRKQSAAVHPNTRRFNLAGGDAGALGEEVRPAPVSDR